MIGNYAREQASTLLRRMAFCAHQAAQDRNTHSIRNLHGAIVHFSECLRVFRRFYPRVQARKVRRRLQKMMELSHEVFSCESALVVIESTGARVSSTALMRISRQRNRASQELLRGISRWQRRNVSRKWRTKLGL